MMGSLAAYNGHHLTKALAENKKLREALEKIVKCNYPFTSLIAEEALRGEYRC